MIFSEIDPASLPSNYAIHLASIGILLPSRVQSNYFLR